MPDDDSPLPSTGHGFWSQQTVESRLHEIVDVADPPTVKQGALELRMGCEAFITGETGHKALDKTSDLVAIPPGQFALLLTKERIKIPLDSIGFISIKFGWKARGLVNVSGFHVDSGFCGWLTFSVYNAGPSEVVVRKGEAVFLLWLAHLDRATPPSDAYSPTNNSGRGQTPQLDTRLMMDLKGEVNSPGVLREKCEKLREEVEKTQSNQKTMITLLSALFVAAVGWNVTLWALNRPTPPSSSTSSPAPTSSVAPVSALAHGRPKSMFLEPSPAAGTIAPRVEIDSANRAALVHWDAVPDVAGYMLAYQVELAPGKTTVPEFVAVPRPPVVFRLDDLTSDQRYVFAVAPVGKPSDDLAIPGMHESSAPPSTLGVGPVPENSVTPYVYFGRSNAGAPTGTMGFYWRSANMATAYRVECQVRDIGSPTWPTDPHSIRQHILPATQTSLELQGVVRQPYRFRVVPIGRDNQEGPPTQWYTGGL